MGTREVYEQKLRSGNLHYDPTINPGLGSPRCPRCLSLIGPNSETGETINGVLHGFTAVAGSGAAALFSGIQSYNLGIPFIQKHVKGPKWLPFAIGIPSSLLISATSATLAGYAVPMFAQMSVTSYHAASSASHYGVSRLTSYIEESHYVQKKPT
ncbi:uncharacterized protein LOC113356435 [Papaver somniferum]|uniref:uncharacterized protein LOC113356435 n=1 Tax=Papaver somniferum TaxID=3469 RepID=UPI000E6FAACD|nr:uncharacterized protein LOC113356435 [Papaver somniferum]XP_026455349.1 uncharacterized protein LOC113356435 [Papaver somniferum]XP_026455350.1 uncharacterized protein LOC113356435 [Papaver somniferum]XP_026455352.1 uncharacterized protein LOC113356435 [Papaver somniferum]XP_026455353.1 uncharacterized protein LOC113356435 [Papaver somniferum]